MMFNKIKQLSNSLKSEDTIVQEIHNSYDACADKILTSLQEEIKEITPVDKVNLLSKYGFCNNKQVQEFNQKKQEVNIRKKNQVLYQELFQFFPQCKVISLQDVGIINKKYGLVFGSVDRYKGDVPHKNLLEIQAFEEKYLQSLFAKRVISHNPWGSSIKSEEISKKEFERSNYTQGYEYTGKYLDIFGISISASIKDMQINSNEQVTSEGFIVSKDPIVLLNLPKKYNACIIITKWGLEASDELVQNENLN